MLRLKHEIHNFKMEIAETKISMNDENEEVQAELDIQQQEILSQKDTLKSQMKRLTSLGTFIAMKSIMNPGLLKKKTVIENGVEYALAKKKTVVKDGQVYEVSTKGSRQNSLVKRKTIVHSDGIVEIVEQTEPLV